MNKDVKKETRKTIYLIIAMLFVGIAIAGGTYALLSSSLNVINGEYNTSTHCFAVDYDITNAGGGTDITGELIPSANPSGGLSGRVGIKMNSGCSLAAKGTITLHVDSSTSSVLTVGHSSYCVSKETLQRINSIISSSACETAGGKWLVFGEEPYCETKNSYIRLPEYTTQSDCTTNNGKWSTWGSPLKYAIYTNASATGTPVAAGRINTADIGNDMVLYSNFTVSTTQVYYYVFIWLDGYLIDNSYVDLPISGSLSATVVQGS